MSPLISRFGAKTSKGFGQFLGASAPSKPPTPSISITDNNTVSASWTGDLGDGGDPITTLTWESSPSLSLTYTNSDITSPVDIDATFIRGTSYTFRFLATNSIGSSDYSEYSSSVTPYPYSVPNAPTIGTCTVVDTNTVNVVFTTPTDDGGQTITDYVVEGRRVDTQAAISLTYTSTDTTTPIPVDAAFASDVAYEFRLAAINSQGTGTYSAWSNDITPNSSVTVPTAPTITSVTRVTDSSVDINFTAPSSNGGATITSYVANARRVSNQAALTITAANSSDVTTPLRYSATGVTEGIQYEFQIAAVNSAGTGAYSDWSPVTINPYDAPGPPTGVTATVVDANTVSISWSGLSSDLTPTSSNITSSPSVTLTYTNSDVTSPISVDRTTGDFALNTAYTFALGFTSSAGTGSTATSNSVTPNPRKLCTSLQISIACCTSTTNCGPLGAGSNCTTLSGTFDPNNC